MQHPKDNSSNSLGINHALLEFDSWLQENPNSDVNDFIRNKKILGKIASELREFVQLTHDVGSMFSDTPRIAQSEIETVVDRDPRPCIEGFQLQRQIGSGGMGTVWLASQEEPIRRNVAIKLLRHGEFSSASVRRFQAEIRALAMMSHPNIAKILSAGKTTTNKPYLVMEYVEGTPITEYCNKHKLSMTARLKLFLQTCMAIQHAHQTNLLHRDIKPDNVLVATIDGKPHVKVIDFGLVKSVLRSDKSESALTQGRTALGSPLWMSPEQATGCTGQIDDQVKPIDIRSDVYSLGVVLYQLLTNTTPITLEFYKRSSQLELLSAISKQSTPYPSVRLSKTPGAKEWVERETGSMFSLWKNKLRNDLDWVVARALEKERERRYSSVDELARDVTRFMDCQPVEARPPSFTYRSGKWLSRNRVMSIACAVVLVALIAAATVSVVMTKRTRDVEQAAAIENDTLKQRARDAERDAKEEEKLVQKLMLSRLEFINKHNPTWPGVSYDPRQEEVLRTMIREIGEDEIYKEYIFMEGGTRICIGDALYGIGRLDDGIEQQRKGLAIFKGENNKYGDKAYFANAHFLGIKYLQTGQPQKALDLANECLNLSVPESSRRKNIFRYFYVRNLARRALVAPEKKVQLAEQLVAEARKAGLKKTGSNWVDVKAAYAEALFNSGRFEDAAREYPAVISMAKKVKRAKRDRIWSLETSLWECWLEIDRAKLSEEMLKKKLELSLAKFGPDSQVTKRIEQLLREFRRREFK